ncbi:hypothetical protein EVAR_89613_1 [Eumeta japonica]|uniref:Uncharacterized protein n=1 Tax=Eumeta variegata TaxID=151549 RepID=A0A4C1XQQ0_EUMVA|nr:hypothetical protein EVAR_89613_1 [Eumeta japonica]
MSRYDAVDSIAQRYLVRLGGDPKNYKRRTDAFDRLAALLDRLLRDYLETLEGSPKEEHKVMSELEEALKSVADKSKPLHKRLAQALTALLVAASSKDVEHDITMASLINSLVDPSQPVEPEEIDKIEIDTICQEIIECGIDTPTGELEQVVRLSVEALRAQLLDSDEAKTLAAEVDLALAIEAPTLSFIGYPIYILFQEADTALVTPPVLRVSMGTGDHQLLSGSHARLSFEMP